LSANFRGKGGRPPTNFGVRKLESLGYHVVLCYIGLRLAVLIQYRRVTHTHTHTDGHAMMSITRAGKNPRNSAFAQT